MSILALACENTEQPSWKSLGLIVQVKSLPPLGSFSCQETEKLVLKDYSCDYQS